MIWNEHSRLAGTHAFLSASNYHWVNYDEDKLIERYLTVQAAQKGTELHELAHRLIKHKVKLPSTKRTLNMYVNDAIGYRMVSEQMLYYSVNCFGTADTMAFRRNKLRIHDLKTGTGPASMVQLMVYMAIFCLEYSIKPHAIEAELRLYQNDDVETYEPTAPEIIRIMDRIVTFDRKIEELKAEELA